MQFRKYVWKIIVCYWHTLEQCCLKHFSTVKELCQNAVAISYMWLWVLEGSQYSQRREFFILKFSMASVFSVGQYSSRKRPRNFLSTPLSPPQTKILQMICHTDFNNSRNISDYLIHARHCGFKEKTISANKDAGGKCQLVMAFDFWNAHI